MMSVRAGKLAIAGEEDRGQRLRESDIGRIVGRHGRSQSPDAADERRVVMPNQREIDEGHKRLGGPLCIEFLCQG